MTNNIEVLLRLRERLVRINKDTDGDNHINESCDALDELDAAPHQPAAGEEIMVNAAHGVFTLPLQPSGLLSGPRFVVHVPAPEQQPAGVDEAAREDAERWRALRELDGGEIYALLGDCDGIHPEQADAAIDRARGKGVADES